MGKWPLGLLSTGLAGLEPTAYGLGNRVKALHCKGLATNLPKYLPKSSTNLAQRLLIWENRSEEPTKKLWLRRDNQVIWKTSR